jgi:hypothetical protein
MYGIMENTPPPRGNSCGSRRVRKCGESGENFKEKKEKSQKKSKICVKGGKQGEKGA